MKLSLILLVVGLAGTLFFLAPAVQVSNWDLYSNPWLIVLGVVFFIVFLVGMVRLRRAIRRNAARRYRR